MGDQYVRRTGKAYYLGQVVRDYDKENENFNRQLAMLQKDPRCRDFVNNLSEKDQRSLIANPDVFFWINSYVNSLCS